MSFTWSKNVQMTSLPDSALGAADSDADGEADAEGDAGSEADGDADAEDDGEALLLPLLPPQADSSVRIRMSASDTGSHDFLFKAIAPLDRLVGNLS